MIAAPFQLTLFLCVATASIRAEDERIGVVSAPEAPSQELRPPSSSEPWNSRGVAELYYPLADADGGVQILDAPAPVKVYPKKYSGNDSEGKLKTKRKLVPTVVDQEEQLSSASDVSQTHVADGQGANRQEFQMYGFDGPHSYKWGYDTGKGHNRQFRFEERDNEGLVKGRYGYYDKHGKLETVHYKSHPLDGFHAQRH